MCACHMDALTTYCLDVYVLHRHATLLKIRCARMNKCRFKDIWPAFIPPDTDLHARTHTRTHIYIYIYIYIHIAVCMFFYI
jgi:hypothetical protein